MGTQISKAALELAKLQNAAAWKKSVPEKVDGLWRIRRHDGELCGFYATRELAQLEIYKKAWFQ